MYLVTFHHRYNCATNSPTNYWDLGQVIQTKQQNMQFVIATHISILALAYGTPFFSADVLTCRSREIAINNGWNEMKTKPKLSKSSLCTEESLGWRETDSVRGRRQTDRREKERPRSRHCIRERVKKCVISFWLTAAGNPAALSHFCSVSSSTSTMLPLIIRKGV